MHRPFVLALLVLVAPSANAAADASPEAALAQDAGRGLKLLHMQGCTACHSLDGRSGVGPSLAGRWGGRASVIERPDGAPRVLRFDAAYLAHSLRAPDDALAEGYPAGIMPAYELSDEQRASIGAALAALPVEPPAPWHGYGVALGLLAVAAAALALVGRRRRATRGR